MNIDNVATAINPVESIPSVETPLPVSSPVKVDAAQKIISQKTNDNRQVTQEKEDKESTVSPEETKQLASELNEIMDDLETNLGFSIREDLDHTVIVEIKNQKTNELIKQIPSEELLTIKEKMLELTGLILDHSV